MPEVAPTDTKQRSIHRYLRVSDGFWCNVCGNLLKSADDLHGQREWDQFEAKIVLDGCPCCDAEFLLQRD